MFMSAEKRINYIKHLFLDIPLEDACILIVNQKKQCLFVIHLKLNTQEKLFVFHISRSRGMEIGK